MVVKEEGLVELIGRKIGSLLISRRFAIAMAGVFQAVFHDSLGLTEQQSTVLAGIAAAWIFGDTYRKTE